MEMWFSEKKTRAFASGLIDQEDEFDLISFKPNKDTRQQSAGPLISVWPSELRNWRRSRILRWLCISLLVITLGVWWFVYQVTINHPSALRWRSMCRGDAVTHYILRPEKLNMTTSFALKPSIWPKVVDKNGRYHGYTPNLEPLTPDHTAWPYKASEIPSLIDAEGLAPVGVLVGVLTTDENATRRQLIRSTYGSHSNSRKAGTEAVRVVFVLGQPRPEYASRVAEEAMQYGDIIILDIVENMDKGKTRAFFAWAAEYAEVPSCVDAQCDGVRSPDWVVKSDDDSFWVLSQLEKRLRVLPRDSKIYWGRLSHRTWDWLEFIQGGGYALSMDLVKAIATSEYALAHAGGFEDQRAADWMRNIPSADQIIWISESCWVYDHPRANGLVSMGFIFPDLVQRILDGNDSSVPSYLTGHRHDAWSTVVPLDKIYRSLALPNLTMERETVALIEGSPLSMFHTHNPDNANLMRGGKKFLVEILRREAERAWSKRKSYSERMRGTLESTVLVHRVKEDKWWRETALALLGQEML